MKAVNIFMQHRRSQNDFSFGEFMDVDKTKLPIFKYQLWLHDGKLQFFWTVSAPSIDRKGMHAGQWYRFIFIAYGAVSEQT